MGDDPTCTVCGSPAFGLIHCSEGCVASLRAQLTNARSMLTASESREREAEKQRDAAGAEVVRLEQRLAAAEAERDEALNSCNALRDTLADSRALADNFGRLRAKEIDRRVAAEAEARRVREAASEVLRDGSVGSSGRYIVSARAFDALRAALLPRPAGDGEVNRG